MSRISACEHIMKDLERYPDGEGLCISYVPAQKSLVHNANTLGGSLLARTWSYTHDTTAYRELAQKAMQYTAQYQRPDASWWYGEKDNLHWVDNFHTAYVLDCFKYYTEATGDDRFDQNMMNGYQYWKKTFFLEDGTPRYYDHKTLPLDIQCCSQAIDTLVFFQDRDPEEPPAGTEGGAVDDRNYAGPPAAISTTGAIPHGWSTKPPPCTGDRPPCCAHWPDFTSGYENDGTHARTKKVLIIVENLPVPFDGRVWKEACSLHENGYEVTVLCPKGKGYAKGYELLEGVHVYRHPCRWRETVHWRYLGNIGSALLWEFFYAWWIFLRRGFQVIQGCNPPDDIFLVALPFKLFGVKYIFDHHDANPELYLSKYEQEGLFYQVQVWLEKLTYRFSDVVMATNQSYKRIWRSSVAASIPADVFVVRNGPDLETFKRSLPSPS